MASPGLTRQSQHERCGRVLSIAVAVSPASSGVPVLADLADFANPLDGLAAFVTHCPFPVFQVDLDCCIKFWSSSAERFYGYLAADAVGKHVSMLVPEVSADGPHPLVELLRSGQVVENYETIALDRDGRHIPVAITIFPMFDAAGQITGSSSISQDITERNHAERALVESEQRFRAAFDVTPAAMSLIGMDGRFIQVNRAACTLLGYGADELQAMHVSQVLTSEDAQLDVVADLLDMSTSPTMSSELPLLRRDGSIRWVRMTVAVLENDQGQPAYFLTHGEDLTRQRTIEDDLRQAESRFQILVENLPAGVYLFGVGSTGNFLYISPYFETMTGYSIEQGNEQIAMDGWLGLVHPEDRERVRERFRDRIDGVGRISLRVSLSHC